MASFGRLLAEGAKDFAAGVYKGMDGKATNQATKKLVNRKSSQMVHMGSAFAKSAPMKGISGSASHYMQTPKANRSIMNSVKAGHMTTVNGQNVLDMKKVAGTAATIGVAGRVATGGGLYRDRYGNVNVPGLPFI